MFRKSILAVAGAGALLLALAGTATPALADSGPPVTVNASVGQTISILGLATSRTFPQAAPGQTVTIDPAESYVVQSNDPNGYVLTLAPQTASFGGLPFTTLSVTEKGPGGTPGTYQFPAGPSPSLTLASTTSATTDGGDQFNEAYNFTAPADAPAGNYTTTLLYTALGS